MDVPVVPVLVEAYCYKGSPDWGVGDGSGIPTGPDGCSWRDVFDSSVSANIRSEHLTQEVGILNQSNGSVTDEQYAYPISVTTGAQSEFSFTHVYEGGTYGANGGSYPSVTLNTVTIDNSLDLASNTRILNRTLPAKQALGRIVTVKPVQIEINKFEGSEKTLRFRVTRSIWDEIDYCGGGRCSPGGRGNAYNWVGYYELFKKGTVTSVSLPEFIDFGTVVVTEQPQTITKKFNIDIGAKGMVITSLLTLADGLAGDERKGKLGDGGAYYEIIRDGYHPSKLDGSSGVSEKFVGSVSAPYTIKLTVPPSTKPGKATANLTVISRQW
ncbi:hypothetical protein [Aeromonas sp. 603079]|uniref:hypothetical protein n=1 Tax=Aeromonas sp. 603079 TaxID=2712045 RepID=UPI003BA3A7B8